jgi:molybdate/tungstate transport system ATP-binding protein
MTLDLSALETSYADFDFGPVDLTVDREVLAVLGPSGSGKTTLLSLVAGITEPDSGSIALDSRELVGRPPEDRNVGIVFQEGALFPHMTARENVAYAGAGDNRVTELAGMLELDDVLDRQPPTLSGGERQRVALARTLAADPDALLLDEPLSSLDAPIRRRLRDELHDLFASLDVPILCVTHDQRTATALGDRVAIVRDGTVEQVGTPSAVLDRPANRFVARFTGNENLFEGHVVERTAEGARVRVGGAPLQAAESDAPGSGVPGSDPHESIAAGSTVTISVHPSRVELAAPDDATGTGKDAARANPLTGTVTRWLHEGTDYRVEVEVGDGVAFTTTVRPPTFDRLGVERGVELAVSVPPEAVHLIPRSAER